MTTEIVPTQIGRPVTSETGSHLFEPTILGSIAREAQRLRTGSTAINNLPLVMREHGVENDLQEDVLLIEEVLFDLALGKGDPVDDDGFVGELGSALVEAYRRERHRAQDADVGLVRGVVVPVLADETAFVELGVAGMLLKDLGIAEGFEVEPHFGHDYAITVCLDAAAATALGRVADERDLCGA